MAYVKKRPEDKLPTGRPTDYNEEIAALICDRIATHTCGLRGLIEKFGDMPCPATIHLWLYKHKEFSDKYAQAKLFQAELLAEECMEIADDSKNDYMESKREEGDSEGWRLNGDHVNRCRLRIDTRKFFISKLLPKKYGKSVDESNGNNEVKTVIELLLGKLTG